MNYLMKRIKAMILRWKQKCFPLCDQWPINEKKVFSSINVNDIIGPRGKLSSQPYYFKLNHIVKSEMVDKRIKKTEYNLFLL